MKKVLSLIMALVLCSGAFATASAETFTFEYGQLAADLGDVNVDTYINQSDVADLTQILLYDKTPQSFVTANVHADNHVGLSDLVACRKLVYNKKEDYFSQGTTTITGSSANKDTWIYQLNNSKIFVREADFGTGSNTINLTHLSDFHLMESSDADFNDTRILGSFNARKKNFAAAYNYGARNARIAMEFASYSDKTVVTGDVTDYFSQGAFDRLRDIIGSTNTFVTLGNHEHRKTWYGTYDDWDYVAGAYSTAEEDAKYKAVQDNFPYNNVFYESEIIRNKLMVIVMNNSAVRDHYQHYYPRTFDYNGRNHYMDNFFNADIALAKEKGYEVLIFQHVPICTGNSADASRASFYPASGYAATADFYNNIAGGPWTYSSANEETAVDRNIYKTITENANIIKGIFCGHVHGHFMSYINAKSTPEAASYDTTIPQYTLPCNVYDYGHAIKITYNYDYEPIVNYQ